MQVTREANPHVVAVRRRRPRVLVVTALIASCLLSSYTAKANNALRPFRDPRHTAIVSLETDAGVTDEAEKTTRKKKSTVMPLSPTRSGASTEAPVQYFEGESCSGAGGYDGSDSEGCSGDTTEVSSGDNGGGGGDVVLVGQDPSGDDDDDDSTSTPASGDDDDDDDDNNTSKTTTSFVAPVHSRGSSPVSRVALLGVLIAFPLRRRRK